MAGNSTGSGTGSKPNSSGYTINYDDRRFQKVESDKNAALNKVNSTYGSMINQADKFYQAQIDASKQWADKQSELQQERTDFAIEQIEQQKDQAQKDYTKEQSGAYVDWQKQSNQYGANAEQMAAQGMDNTGYSESSQVSMYNTYQNRVATARESYNRAVLNYDNAIKDARLQNNAALAEIAYNALQQQLELSLAGFQYKNQLILGKLNTGLDVDNSYYTRYQDVLSQINTENALAEEVRQFNEKMAEERRQYNETMAENKRQFNARYGGSGSSGGSGGSRSSGSSGSIGKSSSGGSTKKTSSTRGVLPSYASKMQDSIAVRNAIDTVVRAGTNAGKSNNTVKTEVNKVINAAVADGAMTKSEAALFKIRMKNEQF